jgi:hypothetical protein
VDPISPNEDIERRHRSVLEPRLDTIAALSERDQSMSRMQPVRRQRARKRREQICPMHLVVRKAKRVNRRVPERRPQQRAPVVPTALVKGDRTDAHTRKFLGEAEAMQDTRCVGAHLDACTDFAQLSRPFVDVHINAGPQQRERSRKATDAAADYANRDLTLPGQS